MFQKLILAMLVALTMSSAHAEAGIRLSIGIGLPIFAPLYPPPRPIYVAPAPVYVVPAAAAVYMRSAPPRSTFNPLRDQWLCSRRTMSSPEVAIDFVPVLHRDTDPIAAAQRPNSGGRGSCRAGNPRKYCPSTARQEPRPPDGGICRAVVTMSREAAIAIRQGR